MDTLTSPLIPPAALHAQTHQLAEWIYISVHPDILTAATMEDFDLEDMNKWYELTPIKPATLASYTPHQPNIIILIPIANLLTLTLLVTMHIAHNIPVLINAPDRTP